LNLLLVHENYYFNFCSYIRNLFYILNYFECRTPNILHGYHQWQFSFCFNATTSVHAFCKPRSKAPQFEWWNNNYSSGEVTVLFSTLFDWSVGWLIHAFVLRNFKTIPVA